MTEYVIHYQLGQDYGAKPSIYYWSDFWGWVAQLEKATRFKLEDVANVIEMVGKDMTSVTIRKMEFQEAQVRQVMDK